MGRLYLIQWSQEFLYLNRLLLFNIFMTSTIQISLVTINSFLKNQKIKCFYTQIRKWEIEV